MKINTLRHNLKHLRFKIRHKLFLLERKWVCHPFFGKFYPKKSIYRRFIAVVLALIVISSTTLFYLRPQTTEAAWFDDSYAYRQKITFVHNAALSNAAMRLTVSNTNTLITAGKMQTDCDDSRFTDSNGELLRYKLVSGCNSASTVYDVVFPTVLNGTNLAYFYYGNPQAASLSDSSVPTGTTPSGATSFATEEKGLAPVVAYSFDEGYGTIAHSTGSCATCSGTLTNMASPPASSSGWTENGKLNKALNFDGLNDMVNMNNNQLTKPATDMSISLWVKFNKTASQKGNNSMLVYKNHTADPWFSYQFYQNSATDVIEFGWMNNSEADFYTSSKTPLSANRWYHITYVKSGSAGKIYVNGVNDTNLTDTHTGTIFDSNDYFRIGGIGGSSYVDGAIDEVKLFNYGLTEAQVKKEFSRSASAVMGSTENAWLTDGLVGYWKIDESSGDTYDFSGNNITLTNNSTTNYTGGKFANAGWFNAASTDYFSTTTDISGIQTVSFWASPSATTDEFISLSTGTADITANSGAIITSGFSSPKVYVNGVLGGEISANNWNHIVAISESPITSTDFWIGRTNAGYANGKIDDVRIYNRSLSSAEISHLYDWAPEPVGWWKLDERSGATAYDSSGNGNNGTLTNGPVWSTGKVGSGVKFDGTNDYATMGDISALDTATQLSGCAWVQQNSNTADGLLLNKWNASDNGFILFRDDVSAASARTDIYSIYIADSADGDTARLETSSNVAASLNTWNYVCFTFEAGSTTGLRLYVNGVETTDSPVSTASIGAIDAGAAALAVGARDDGSSSYDGKIDDVRIYNYARTPKQIISDMNAGHPAVGSPIASAIGHWKFDEGYGTVANNSGNGGASLNGTLTNMDSPATYGSGWTNSGKFGKAVNFDGNNDNVSVPSNPSLAITGDLTLSIWAKRNSANIMHDLIDYAAPGELETANHLYEFYLDASNNLVLEWEYNAGSNEVVTSSKAVSMPSGSWVHYMVTRNSISKQVDFYENGVRLGTTQTYTNNPTGGSLSSFVIGRDNASTIQVFDGTLDEVKIYNYALSADEVKTEYNQGKSLVLGALATDADGQSTNSAARAYCPPGNTETNCAAGLNPAPVAHWTLDERRGPSVNDTSGNGNIGTLTNGPNWTTGKNGASVNFDGTDDHIAIPVTSSTDIQGSEITLSAWIYATSLGGTNIQRILSMPHNGEVGTEKYALLLNNSSDELEFWIGLSADDHIGVNYSSYLNGWHYVAGVYSNDVMRIYIDGVLASGPTNHAGSGSIIGHSLDDMRIGSYSNTFGQYFLGKIDDVRIYNYARSQSQVAWEYNRGGPIGHWKFDECQGTTAYDSSGNRINGTISFGASGNTAVGTCGSGTTTEMWDDGTSGKYNSSLGFDGTNDYVQMSDTSLLKPTTLTISAWVKPTNFTCTGADTNCQIFAKYGGDNTGYQLLVNSSGVVAGYLYNGVINTNVSSTRPLAVNTWQLVTLTWDGTDAKLYINGIHNNTDTGAITLTHNTTAPTIGKASWYSGNYFNGLIDDVRVYSYPLSPTQIKLLYNENSAVRFGPVTGSP